MTIPTISDLWHSANPQDWDHALARYWTAGYIKPALMALEREMDSLDPRSVEKLDPNNWYEFLKEKYFRWKFTAPNRYVTTTAQLMKYQLEDRLEDLHRIKVELFSLDMHDVEAALRIALQIQGLGTAGASGLLAVLFARYFATVDQFAVKALKEVKDLPAHSRVSTITADNITLRGGTLLINIMRRKADENNRLFVTDFWTPRKIDTILWTYGRTEHAQGWAGTGD